MIKKIIIILTAFILAGCGDLAYGAVERFFNQINSAENIGVISISGYEE